MASTFRHAEDALLNLGLPSDPQCELAVIACCIRYPRRRSEYLSLLGPDVFVTEANRILFRRIAEIAESSEAIDTTVLWARLMEHNEGASVGGLSYLSEIMTATAVDWDVNHYAKPLLDAYARRRLILKCNEAMIRLAERSEPTTSVAAELEDESRTCAIIGDPQTGFSDLEDSIRDAGGFDAFLKRTAGDAIRYPWSGLNRMTNGGMKPGQLIVIAGPTGQGKTALALNIAADAAQCGMGVPLVFSLEMERDEINERLLALTSGVDSYLFKRLDAEQRPRVSAARQKLKENRVLIDDEDSVTISSIRSRVKRHMGRESICMVLVDYIQLVEGGKDRGETREQEIARVTRGLKRMAMQLKIPVVALSQINEDAGANTRPAELRDLRESRSIGHNANLVAFLHFTRPYDVAAGVLTGDLDLLIRKQRGGPKGIVPLRFHAPTGAFYEIEAVPE